jgi:hypothetical protein
MRCDPNCPRGKLIVNQLDESFQKIERSFLKLILGTGGGIILLVVISVAGYRFYANWKKDICSGARLVSSAAATIRTRP